MHFIKELVLSSGILDVPIESISISCINTTRPIYLIFLHDSEYPIIVARRLSTEELDIYRSIDCRLYSVAGNLVPRPLGEFQHAGHQYSLQAGVKGAPWFQLKAVEWRRRERIEFEERAWQTLHMFQEAALSLENDNEKLSAQQELRRAFLEYLGASDILDMCLEPILGMAEKDFEKAQVCKFQPQHGDFCINNLIVSKDNITVIDFEDFLITKMPLYDHFTLALSLLSLSSKPLDLSSVLNHGKIILAARDHDIDKNLIKWHFLHHILLRLGTWSIGENRKFYRESLKKLLNEFIIIQNFFVK